MYDRIISLDNLFSAWKEFKRGKARKEDVARFELHLEDSLFGLRDRLVSGAWEPDPYAPFSVCDPKPRRIHKASVRDRVLHQAIFRCLDPLFDPIFIFDSYSSRRGKGTHAGFLRAEQFGRNVSRNFSEPVYALKCDVRRFFDSFDHEVLLRLISRRVRDPQVQKLLGKIIRSFETRPGKGIPLGNVTSQLFANIYLHELDRFVKHGLKQRYYARYCDDFVIFGKSRDDLQKLIPLISDFLENHLLLSLHPDKVVLRKLSQGIDFLGYVALPHYSVLRTRTKRRMMRKLMETPAERMSASVHSYAGMLKHCKGFSLRDQIEKIAAHAMIDAMIDAKDIEKLAELARIELTEAEKTELAGDIGNILQYVDQIKAAGAAAGDSRPKDSVRNVMRLDAGAHESGAHTDALVAEFPKKDGGSNALKVKKILG